MKVLVLNAGSSSLKAALREFGPGPVPYSPPPPLWESQLAWDGERRADIVRRLVESLWTGAKKVVDTPRQIDVVGHRVVHGGKRFVEPAAITPEVLAEIRKYAELAPEHNRIELEVMEASRQVLDSNVPQVAVFDTAFHGTLPLAARVYPGPYAWYEQGIERFGFHGISHQYCARRAAEILGRELDGLKLVSCHLGNGASLAAVRDGRSVDTTMGFTPLEGLMMGSRSGSIDPGILVYLARHCGYTASKLDELLNEESGLKGVSGISSDMREIVKAMDRGDERAHLAFDIYTHRLCREIGGMVASLGGIDALAFTAGVGENTPLLRTGICGQLGFLGIRLDEHRNASAPRDVDVSLANSQVRVLVIHTNEEWEIACECCRLLQKER